jgi:fumarate reductase subunit D
MVDHIRFYSLATFLTKTMRRRLEPFWWSLFGAGGTVAALTLPVLMIIFGIAIPFGIIKAPPYEILSGILNIWWARVLLVIVISLSMFHWAHRFRFTLYEGLQLHHLSKTIAFLCYGTAIVMTALSGYLLLI